jgi:hypothetical protein
MTFHCESFSSDRQPEKRRTLDRFAINQAAMAPESPQGFIPKDSILSSSAGIRESGPASDVEVMERVDLRHAKLRADPAG